MTHAISAERIKLTSTRSPYWCIGIVVVMALGVAAITAVTAADAGITDSITVSMLAGLSRLGVIVLMIMAILAITSEHRFGTLKVSFLAIPHRERVLVAKAIVYGGVAFAVSLVLAVLCVLLGVAVVGAPDVDFGDPVVVRHIWGIPVFATLCVLIGLGVGAIVRQTAGAIVIVLVWMLAVETLLSVLPKVGPAVGPFMPFNNGYRFLDGSGTADVEYHWGTYGSLIYFAIVAVVVFVAGVVVTARRDA